MTGMRASEDARVGSRFLRRLTGHLWFTTGAYVIVMYFVLLVGMGRDTSDLRFKIPAAIYWLGTFPISILYPLLPLQPGNAVTEFTIVFAPLVNGLLIALLLRRAKRLVQQRDSRTRPRSHEVRLGNDVEKSGGN